MIVTMTISAQSWDEVKSSPSVYLWGEGFGETDDDADDEALKDLIGKIADEVGQRFVMTADEQDAGGKTDQKSYNRQKMETYGAVVQSQAERIILSREPKGKVVRWMKRADVNRIFEGRVSKVKEYFRLGKNAEKDIRVGDALRYYYWAFSLLKTVPGNTDVTASADGRDYPLVTFLPSCLDHVFDHIQAKVADVNGNLVTVEFTYEGRPVSSLDYTYFDGRDRSKIYTAKNGKGILELVADTPTDNLQIQYEYIYRQEAANLDKETAAVLKVVKGKGPGLRKSNVKVSGSGHSRMSSARDSRRASDASSKVNATKFGVHALADPGIYKANLDKVLSAIGTRRYERVSNLFTPDGWDMYLRLVTYGEARLMGTADCQFYAHGDNVVARSVPMSFRFKDGVRTAFVEDIVFTFTKDGKIDCLAFGLDAEAQQDVLNKGEWSESARKSIMEFLENYKTAYALKRLEYIQSIFDDNAVIIVGHSAMQMVRTSGRDQLPNYKASRAVVRTQYSKEQYMKNLERCFNSNEYVNIRFGDNDIIKAGDGREIYGIQLKQDYYSTNYGDQGYLFLRVDLTNPKEPNISVRTWQAQPDPIDGLYGLGDF